MSFTASATGTIFSAGDFLVNPEDCTRETATIASNHGQIVTLNGRKIVPAGAFVPSRGSSSVGILYEDIDVTDGAAPGSIITEGKVYDDMLPLSSNSDARSALAGITFVSSPAVTRPAIYNKELAALTVTSEASASATGKTAVTVTGHTLASGESYLYKIGSTAAPTAKLGEVLPTSGGSAWSTWDGEAEISSTTGYKMTMAVVDSFGQCVAAGSADVTVKAAG